MAEGKIDSATTSITSKVREIESAVTTGANTPSDFTNLFAGVKDTKDALGKLTVYLGSKTEMKAGVRERLTELQGCLQQKVSDADANAKTNKYPTTIQLDDQGVAVPADSVLIAGQVVSIEDLFVNPLGEVFSCMMPIVHKVMEEESSK